MHVLSECFFSLIKMQSVCFKIMKLKLNQRIYAKENKENVIKQLIRKMTVFKRDVFFSVYLQCKVYR